MTETRSRSRSNLVRLKPVLAPLPPLRRLIRKANRGLDSIALRPRFLTDSRTQSASLIALGAFAVHQLRYFALYAFSSDDQLPQPGHAYLAHAIPVLVGLVLATLTARLVRWLIGGRPTDSKRRIKATSYALGIVAVFSCQELIEGALFAGHAAGLAAIFSAGGWAALPLAALFGVLAALIDRGIEAIEARLGAAPPPEAHAALLLEQADDLTCARRRLTPLAFGLARRPPPALSI